MRQTLAITRKELNSYFGSPMALIFIGVFLAAALFTFFWIDTFFARGIADVRPLFRWMPILLLFLVAALTMRQWSEEAQSGTLEILLTLPASPWQLVIGKFLAVMALIALALGLTFFLPVTVALLGNLDWGPVIGGYLAALLLAAAYTAIGLFISSRTNNEIVALILSVLVGGVLYLLGTTGVTEFAGDSVGNVLRAFATGSHFESIERGVLDARDLAYYLSIACFFLALNIVSVDSRRWSHGAGGAGHRRNAIAGVTLLGLNLLVLNILLARQPLLRLDLTQQHEYTLSPVTRDLLGDLQEPLLIRAYFSDRTHPLLAPLVPRIVDLLREYEVAGKGDVIVEVVNPADNPDLEAEANQTYGIRPTPFQIAGRYESSVVNSYFDILVRYGNQNQILNFRDLIEVEALRDGTVDVRLRNLEYDLTRSIKRAVFGFQDLDSILAALPAPAKLMLVVTPDTLPPDLQGVQATIKKVAGDIQSTAGDKFSFTTVNPNDPNSPLTPQALADQYGIQPYAASLFDNTTYYLHMILQVGDQAQVIFPSGDLTEADIRTSIEATLKRFSPGFLKVVGLWRPTIAPDPMLAQFGQTGPQPFTTWDVLAQALSQEYEVRQLDLTNGQVPPDVNVLLLVAPQEMTELQRYAVDQFLMAGGAVVVAGSNERITADPFTGTLTSQPITDGLADLLAHYGVEVSDALVLDPQNEPFPIAVSRPVGDFTVQEIQSLDYPYFVDVRADGMAKDSAIIANLPAVTLNWVAPVTATQPISGERQIVELLKSSPQSWTSTDSNIQPNPELFPEYGFPTAEPRAPQTLAVSIIGAFDSFYAGKERPQPDPQQAASAPAGPTAGTIDRSPSTARLVVIGSGDFLNDTVFNLSSQLSADSYLNSLQLVTNAVDWSVEDLDLLGIRARGAHARILDSLSQDEQSFWEFLNYALAIAAVVVIGAVWALRRRNERPMELTPRGEIRDPEEAGHAHS